MKIFELVKQAKFDIGEKVEFSIKSGKDTGIVLHVIICPDGILYEVIWSGKNQLRHYEIELEKCK